VLLSRDVTAVWWLVLSIVGYQAFTQRSLAFSAAVVLGPIALIVAIGMLIALR
jgi:predicted membrane-bound mannosyltransferase